MNLRDRIMNTTVKAEKTQPRASHQQIATQAYMLWESDGRLPGRDLEYWLKAEQQLNGVSQPIPSQTISSNPVQRPLAEARSGGNNHLRRRGNGPVRSELLRP